MLAVDAAGGGLLLVIAIALMLGLAGGTVLIAVVRRVAVAARPRRPCTGAEGLVGRVGVVRSPPGPDASVFVDGELWRAQSFLGEQDALRAGDRVVVERVCGLAVAVRRAEEWELDP